MYYLEKERKEDWMHYHYVSLQVTECEITSNNDLYVAHSDKAFYNFSGKKRLFQCLIKRFSKAINK